MSPQEMRENAARCEELALLMQPFWYGGRHLLETAEQWRFGQWRLLARQLEALERFPIYRIVAALVAEYGT